MFTNIGVYNDNDIKGNIHFDKGYKKLSSNLY